MSNCASSYRYHVCGLRIVSDTRFSLRQARFIGAPDIAVNLKIGGQSALKIHAQHEEIGQIRNGAGYPSITVYRIEEGLILECHNTLRRVEFYISADRRRIDCFPHVDATIEDVELWLFGLVMSFVLQSRGIFTVHASAVSYNGKAVAFLGSNGYGKTTLAYYFAKQGHRLITDDVLPIITKAKQLLVHPGAPSMNLWSQTLANLKSAQEASGIGKHRYGIDLLNVKFCDEAIPLHKLYFIQPTMPNNDSVVEIETMAGARCLIELLCYTRASTMIGLEEQKKLLETYGSLLSQTSARKLTYKRGFDCLPDVYSSICEDLKN